jgi:hypothetical protein
MRAVRIYDRVEGTYQPRGQVLEDGTAEGSEAFLESMVPWIEAGVFDRRGQVHHQGVGLLEALRDIFTTGFTSAAIVEDHTQPWGPAPDPWEAASRRCLRAFRLSADRSHYYFAGELYADGTAIGDEAFQEFVATMMERGGFYHPDDMQRYKEGPRMLEAAFVAFNRGLFEYANIEDKDSPPSTPLPSPWGFEAKGEE